MRAELCHTAASFGLKKEDVKNKIKGLLGHGNRREIMFMAERKREHYISKARSKMKARGSTNKKRMTEER